MKVFAFVYFLVFWCLIYYVECSNILAIFHTASHSHYKLGLKFLMPLAEKGHKIIMASPFKLKNSPSNWRDIEFRGIKEKFNEGIRKVEDLANLKSFQKELFSRFMCEKFTEDFMSHPSFEDLLRLKQNETFDVIILEKFLNEALIGLSHHFQTPYILLGTTSYSRWFNDIVGNPGSPAYIPDLFLNYSSNMNLWQRFYNTILYCFSEITKYFLWLPRHQKLLEKYIPNSPKLQDLYYNASLLFLNTHLSIKFSTPTVPNLIEIGGYHLDPPKNLSEDLQKFMDSATEGVIYFSLGSIVKSKDMNVKIRDAILRTFASFKQKVLWKWEEESTFDVPDNVVLAKWLPQQDLLAHKNIKLFITHGGLLSTIEGVSNSVPLLAIPVFADQMMNAAEIQDYGYGLYLPYADFDEEKFKRKINEVLINPSYKNNVAFKSKIFHDRETSPKDKIIFWTEFVIRHKGAPHMKSVTLSLNWYQYLLLDVIFIMITILFVNIFIIRKCLKWLFKKNKKEISGDKKRK